jgi:hypothetical protein
MERTLRLCSLMRHGNRRELGFGCAAAWTGLGAGLAAWLLAGAVRAEAGVFDAPLPPFSCAASSLTLTTVPRSAPALVLRRSSLGDAPSYAVVGDNGVTSLAASVDPEEAVLILKPSTRSPTTTWSRRWTMPTVC